MRPSDGSTEVGIYDVIAACYYHKEAISQNCAGSLISNNTFQPFYVLFEQFDLIWQWYGCLIFNHIKKN